MPASTKTIRTRREPAAQAAPLPGRFDALLAFGICVGLALVWTLPLSNARAWGWDESMHAELPAARMLVALRQGDLALAHTALLDCQQYPFVWPLVLTGVQALTGISEHACRVAGTLAWCWALFGLFLLGRELGARIEPRLPGARWLSWSLFALGALSPLALAYSGTLFLEVPFACMAVWALRAWVRRDGSLTRELAAGEWITLALFTKWNYGLLLGGGLALAWYCEGFAARRELGKYIGRTIVLLVVPLIACLWWFVLARGEEHRAALLGFLQGNREIAPHAQSERWMHAALSLHLGPLVLACVLALALAALVRLRSTPVCMLFCVALAFVLPAWTHPFHLDRFLIPQALPVWALAAVGFACARMYVRLGIVGLFLLGCAGIGRPTAAGKLLPRADTPEVLAYQRQIVDSWRSLRGARDLPTGGLDRAVHDALLDALAREVGPKERVGWIGMSSELSPAVLQLGLLARGGAEERFLRESPRMLDLSYEGLDPKSSSAELQRFAQGFDVLICTLPPDIKDRPARRFTREYVVALEALGWSEREIARTEVARPLQAPLELTLFACRPKP